MKKFIFSLLTLGLLSMSSSAWAHGPRFFEYGYGPPHGHHHGVAGHAASAVPELDGSMAMVALALISGGLAVAHGRRRKDGQVEAV